MTEVIIVSHHPVFRQGLQVMLTGSADFRVAGWSTGLDLNIARMSAERGHLIVADFDSSMDLKELRAICAVRGSRICLFVQDLAEEFLFQLRELGVAGIISARRCQSDLLAALNKIAQGQLFFDSALTPAEAPNGAIRLSPREGQLIELLTHGLKNKEIAAQLNITEGTVKVYLSKLFQKVGAKDRFDLALSGLKHLGITPGANDSRVMDQDGAGGQGLRKFVTPQAKPRDGQGSSKTNAA